ncbi:L-threonylcarbamoyladenylate synthase [Jonquetella anthropi]|uniref:L-threonylcarbamoyladenylate synthase n=1 Tax=Jonquetella anthropi TaxID=428712 RepID=UPI0001B9109F|nr:L-threonylcarbamoyladenylate synthase [Jonquetella anthropi]EEX48140.1 Sua5/YciO/YrdC/YwlC family protein [Jonquetella anthropi E3_33 E1]
MTQVLPFDPNKPDRAVLNRAVKLLSDGRLVAFPTETVYGLGGNGWDSEAAKRIYAAKGRPSDNPLILHFPSPEAVELSADVSDRAKKLMARFWPGPLTLVLPAKPIVPLAVRGGLDTVGCRMPSHPTARALLSACPFPLAAPSANVSGRPSPTDAATVAQDLNGRVDLVIDSGPCSVGLESTVLDITGDAPVLLRPGGVSLEELESVLGPVAFPRGALELRRSPGTRYRHYAPAVAVLLWKADEPFDWPSQFCFMGQSEPPVRPARQILFDDLAAFAHGYFAGLRDLERENLPIVVQWPDGSGIGRALQDRLKRSAGLE